ncbi:MAG: hypothetical protein H0U79_08845 [Solirubrobacterales bacterium]|nr:hypothetical protein [Solirubrobacterales bacterium]
MPFLDEDRCRDDKVADVGVAPVGVVAGKHVAVLQLTLEVLRDLLQDEVQRRRVDRDRVEHADLARYRVVQRA